LRLPDSLRKLAYRIERVRCDFVQGTVGEPNARVGAEQAAWMIGSDLQLMDARGDFEFCLPEVRPVVGSSAGNFNWKRLPIERRVDGCATIEPAISGAPGNRVRLVHESRERINATRPGVGWRKARRLADSCDCSETASTTRIKRKAVGPTPGGVEIQAFFREAAALVRIKIRG